VFAATASFPVAAIVRRATGRVVWNLRAPINEGARRQNLGSSYDQWCTPALKTTNTVAACVTCGQCASLGGLLLTHVSTLSH